MKSLIKGFMVFFVAVAAQVWAELPGPQGPVVLEVTGDINEFNHGESAQFDLAQLQQLPKYSIRTQNPWEEGAHTFVGFKPADLMTLLKATGSTLRISAFNHYITEIPLTDFTDFDAIIAYEMDGLPMLIRTKGPLMVIYNFDSDTILRSETYYGRSIWQIESIKIMRDGGS